MPEHLMAFFLASVVLAIAPGPDNLFVLTQSALYGRRVGIWVTCGLCIGLLVHTTAVALGLAVIFQTSQLAFDLLRYAGAGYLSYLAWGAWNAPDDENFHKPDSETEEKETRFGMYLRRGVVMNVTNPKVSIFFLAFLPQFITTNGHFITQVYLLGALFMLATLLVFSTIAVLSAELGNWLKTIPNWHRILNRLASLVFIGLALRLVLMESGVTVS